MKRSERDFFGKKIKKMDSDFLSQPTSSYHVWDEQQHAGDVERPVGDLHLPEERLLVDLGALHLAHRLGGELGAGGGLWKGEREGRVRKGTDVDVDE